MHVATTIPPVQDVRLTEQVHDIVGQIALVPAEHVVDAAYITPAHIQRAQEVHGITLLGPIVADHNRQAKSGHGFGKSAFTSTGGISRPPAPRATSAGNGAPCA